jgi:dihydroorotate dehydrogenase
MNLFAGCSPEAQKEEGFVKEQRIAVYDDWLRELAEFLTEPLYRVDLSYEWNNSNGPMPPEKEWRDFLQRNGTWRDLPSSPPVAFLGFDLCSELGVAAGPLLNSAWIKRCADLGYGLLSYKTVRTRQYPSHPLPNILCLDSFQRIEPDLLPDHLFTLAQCPNQGEVTITNSFGIPSLEPEGAQGWMEDVGKAKSYLRPDQALVVSVVGTPPGGQEKVPLAVLAHDFATCAAMAAEAGADMIEANLSCPNVPGEEGDLYDNPDAVEAIARSIRRQVKQVPLGLKLGYLSDLNCLCEVALRAAHLVDFLTSLNSVKLTVKTPAGEPALDAKRSESGVCGYAIQDLALSNVREICRLREEHKLPLSVIGCGGISSPADVAKYLASGADAVEVATSAIWRPSLGVEWKAFQLDNRSQRLGS